MKIAVVGGGSTYTPELVDGPGRMRDVLPVDDLVLVDPDEQRLELVAAFGRRILALVAQAQAAGVDAEQSTRAAVRRLEQRVRDAEAN